MSQENARAPILTVALIGTLWGLNWPVVKFMLTELPPLTLRAVAFGLAALCLGAISAIRHEALRPPRHEVPAILVTAFFLIFGFNVLTAIGQILTETSKAAIIAYTMPAQTAVLAVVLLGERIEPRHIVSLALGMSGLAVLASENFEALVADPAGPAIMFVAALSWALGNISLKARTWSLSPLSRTVWFFAVASAACWLLVVIFEPPWRQQWPSAPVQLAMLYHVIGPMVICYALWSSLVGRLSATVAAIAALLAPVVGVASSIALLGDPLTWQKVVSLTLILASILLSLAAPVSAGPATKPAKKT